MSSPSPPALQELHRLDRSSSEFHDQVSNVLYGEKYMRCVEDLQGGDLVWLVDYLDKALGTLDPSSAAFRKCLRELRSICGTRAIIPTSYMISPHLLNINKDPFASGGYGDVYQGTLGDAKICIKRVRVYTQDGPHKVTKAFYKEAVTWKRLTHPNIVPLLGITITPFQLISDWMSSDLPKYIKMNSDADRLKLLCDVAKGLCYLHSCNVIHGDLKGSNILVDDCGHARIADFGLATVARDTDSEHSTSDDRGHAARWKAPEVLTEQGACSKKADVFSFAMVVTEAFTGMVPFHGKLAVAATFDILSGIRPPRPKDPTVTETLWALMQRCWAQDPHSRPDISEALQVLRTPDIHKSWINANDRLDTTTTNISSPSITHVTTPNPGLTATYDDGGLPVSPLGSPPSVRTILMTPQDGGQLHDPPRTMNQKKGWIGDRLVHSARKALKATTRKLCELSTRECITHQ